MIEYQEMQAITDPIQIIHIAKPFEIAVNHDPVESTPVLLQNMRLRRKDASLRVCLQWLSSCACLSGMLFFCIVIMV